jgi:hypothetical protein
MEIARRVTAFWAAHCARIDLLFTMSDITRDVRPKPGRADLSFRKRALVAGSNEMASAAKMQLKVHGRVPAPSGGARRDRTDDLLLAKQALSQLSYGPSEVRYQRSAIRSQSSDAFLTIDR